MQYQNVKKDYFIYIEKNEMVMSTITKFCISEGIKNARISGIGAVKNTEIGAYDIIAKKYIKKTIFRNIRANQLRRQCFFER
jgi:predicted DNA-binding protein with PD1-like motif